MSDRIHIRTRLYSIHSALDDALGDTDVTHIESEEELREMHPVQWAAQKLAEIIDELAPKPNPAQRKTDEQVGPVTPADRA